MRVRLPSGSRRDYRSDRPTLLAPSPEDRPALISPRLSMKQPSSTVVPGNFRWESTKAHLGGSAGVSLRYSTCRMASVGSLCRLRHHVGIAFAGHSPSASHDRIRRRWPISCDGPLALSRESGHLRSRSLRTFCASDGAPVRRTTTERRALLSKARSPRDWGASARAREGTVGLSRLATQRTQAPFEPRPFASGLEAGVAGVAGFRLRAARAESRAARG